MNYKELLFDTLEKLGLQRQTLVTIILSTASFLWKKTLTVSLVLRNFYTLILRITTAQHGNVSRRIYEIVFSLYGSLPMTVCSKKSSAEAVLTTDLQIKNFLSILMNILIQ